MSRLLVLFTLTLAACGGAAAPDEGPPAGHAEAREGAVAGEGEAKATYACPMHPDVTADAPGECSKCGMALVQQEAHDHASHEHGDGEQGH